MFTGADACILVYDVTNLNSFEALDRWREEFLRQVGNGGRGGLDSQSHKNDRSVMGSGIDVNNSFPFLLLGNKVDKEDSESNFLRSRAEEWCRLKANGPRPIPYFETSAKNSLNVQEAFLEAASMALMQTLEAEKRKRIEPEMYYPPVQTLDLNRGDYSGGGGGAMKNNFCC